MTRKTFYGTHRGEFWGIPPTGKKVTIDLIDILRITDGQMVEHWNLVDWMGLMQQLQAIPPPRPAAIDPTTGPNPPKGATQRRRLLGSAGPRSTAT